MGYPKLFSDKPIFVGSNEGFFKLGVPKLYNPNLVAQNWGSNLDPEAGDEREPIFSLCLLFVHLRVVKHMDFPQRLKNMASKYQLHRLNQS
jgi:hypothetical protein